MHLTLTDMIMVVSCSVLALQQHFRKHDRLRQKHETTTTTQSISLNNCLGYGIWVHHIYHVTKIIINLDCSYAISTKWFEDLAVISSISDESHLPLGILTTKIIFSDNEKNGSNSYEFFGYQQYHKIRAEAQND